VWCNYELASKLLHIHTFNTGLQVQKLNSCFIYQKLEDVRQLKKSKTENSAVTGTVI